MERDSLTFLLVDHHDGGDDGSDDEDQDDCR
jgi:hypothetical protein